MKAMENNKRIKKSKYEYFSQPEMKIFTSVEPKSKVCNIIISYIS